MSFAELWGNGYVMMRLSEHVFADGQEPLAILLLLAAVLVFAMIIPYLLGSINTAVILSRLLYHDDVRKHGSGNAGMTNMLRTYGKGAAGLTLLGDMLKTVLAVGVGSLAMSCNFGGWIAALFCMMGHIFPIYYHYRGGKGVLCAATAVLLLSPFSFLFSFVTFVILVSMTRYVSLGSLIGAMMLPLYVNASNAITQSGGINGFVSVAMALLILWCHRENIRRIQQGKESKLSFHKTPSGKDGEGHA